MHVIYGYDDASSWVYWGDPWPSNGRYNWASHGWYVEQRAPSPGPTPSTGSGRERDDPRTSPNAAAPPPAARSAALAALGPSPRAASAAPAPRPRAAAPSPRAPPRRRGGRPRAPWTRCPASSPGRATVSRPPPSPRIEGEAVPVHYLSPEFVAGKTRARPSPAWSSSPARRSPPTARRPPCGPPRRGGPGRS